MNTGSIGVLYLGILHKVHFLVNYRFRVQGTLALIIDIVQDFCLGTEVPRRSAGFIRCTWYVISSMHAE